MESQTTTLPLKQLVFRAELRSPLPERKLSLGAFHFCPSATSALPLSSALLSRFGVPGTLKMFGRLLTPSREFICVAAGGRLATYAVVNVGFCRRYAVEPGAILLCNGWTDPQYRGRGLMEGMLARAINHLIARGSRIFYMDTRENNTAMRIVIERFGFGPPVSTIEPYD